MKEVPKKREEEVGGGDILYEPWCPPGDLGYPRAPGCPAVPDPVLPVVEPSID